MSLSPALPWSLRRQRGVAVITALLLTTLAVTIVTSLFWLQQVQVRSMENQRLQLQTRWILRGALDLSRLVLSQDYTDSQTVTHLGGIWATPLEETRLDDYVERERVENESFNATLSGRMIDAQSRYNLANLANNRIADPKEVNVFQRLLTNLQLDPGLAQAVARQGADSQPVVPAAQGQPPAQSGGAEPMALMRVEDLLAVAGFTPQAVERLRDYVIVLPEQTPVNVNTAPAELLAALTPNLSLSDAAAMVYTRKNVYYRDEKLFKNLPQMAGKVPDGKYALFSNYFLAYSKVRLDRAALDSQALLKRQTVQTSVVWIREN